MSYINFLVENLIFFPAALLCYLPMKNSLRFSQLRTVAFVTPLLVGFTCGYSLLEMRFSPLPIGMELVLLLLFFLLYQLTLRVHLSKSLGIFLTIIALMSIVYNFTLCLRGLYGLGSEKSLRSAGLFSGIGGFAALLLAYPAAKYGSKMVSHDLPNDIGYASALLSVMFTALNYQIRPLASNLGENLRMTLFILAMCATQFLTWAILQALAYSVCRSIISGTEAKERNRLYEMEALQYRRQQRYIKTAEHMIHDFRHNIRTLESLYRAGDMETLGKYLQQYAESLPVKERVEYTGQTALNALLNYYARMAEQEQITLKIRVSLPETLPVKDVDLCGMVSNILENAIVAASRSDDRLIRLDILADSDRQLFIAAGNSFDGVVRQRAGVYYSTTHPGAGTGLTSITATAEKYGGMARFYHEGTMFYSDIAIPLQEDHKERST